MEGGGGGYYANKIMKIQQYMKSDTIKMKFTVNVLALHPLPPSGVSIINKEATKSQANH